MKELSVEIKIIGLIHSPFKTRNDAPRQGNKKISKIEIFDDYAEGLNDIDGFSHLNVFYWLHESKGFTLMVNTPWDSVPHGLFTTRSPHRPNPIGFAVASLVKREDNVLFVEGLDAIDNTPVIDIKPYIKDIDMKKDSKDGWISKKEFK